VGGGENGGCWSGCGAEELGGGSEGREACDEGLVGFLRAEADGEWGVGDLGGELGALECGFVSGIQAKDDAAGGSVAEGVRLAGESGGVVIEGEVIGPGVGVVGGGVWRSVLEMAEAEDVVGAAGFGTRADA
jgi:hypothetical protein